MSSYLPDPNVDADSDWEASEREDSEDTIFGMMLGFGKGGSFGKGGNFGKGGSFGPGGTTEAFRMLSEALRTSELNSWVCLLACHGS